MDKIAEEQAPRRSVRSLIGVWEKRIAEEADAAAQAKQRIERVKKPREIQSLFDPAELCTACQRTTVTPPAIAEPKPTPQLAKPKFAKATKPDARLRLSRLPEPFGWGKKGIPRG